jgi:hypothetical protein
VKRSKELAPRSRDHHQRLFLALKRGARDARAAFLAFWVDGRRRFAIEEQLGHRLEVRIRHEENVLFGLIEQALPRDELVAPGDALARAERDSPRSPPVRRSCEEV